MKINDLLYDDRVTAIEDLTTLDRPKAGYWGDAEIHSGAVVVSDDVRICIDGGIITGIKTPYGTASVADGADALGEQLQAAANAVKRAAALWREKTAPARQIPDEDGGL